MDFADLSFCIGRSLGSRCSSTRRAPLTPDRCHTPLRDAALCRRRTLYQLPFGNSRKLLSFLKRADRRRQLSYANARTRCRSSFKLSDEGRVSEQGLAWALSGACPLLAYRFSARSACGAKQWWVTRSTVAPNRRAFDGVLLSSSAPLRVCMRRGRLLQLWP